MIYRGYAARIQYSAEDQCFFGSLENIPDVISFEGDGLEELEVAFRDAVDDYIDICERIGRS